MRELASYFRQNCSPWVGGVSTLQTHGKGVETNLIVEVGFYQEVWT